MIGLTTLAMVKLGAKTVGAGLKYNAANKKADALSEKKGAAMQADYERATAKNDYLMKESAKKSAQIGMERTEQNIRASQSLAKTRGKTMKLQGQSQQSQAMSGQIGASASVTSNDIMRQESDSLSAQMYNNEVANMNLNNKAVALHDTSINQFTDMKTTSGSGTANLSGAVGVAGLTSILASDEMGKIFDDYFYPAATSVDTSNLIPQFTPYNFLDTGGSLLDFPKMNFFGLY
jgi:hypothetical protein